MTEKNLYETVESILPQTQCRQCGFDGCRHYARAMIDANAPINRCATGGKRGIKKLARALGRPVVELDPEYGHEMPLALAKIDTGRCIGCQLCAKVCPVDAVTGVPKHLFAVVQSDCTGCALCVPACPMDCIRLFDVDHVWDETDSAKAKRNHEAKERREAELLKERAESLNHTKDQKRSVIEQVLALAKKR